MSATSTAIPRGKASTFASNIGGPLRTGQTSPPDARGHGRLNEYDARPIICIGLLAGFVLLYVLINAGRIVRFSSSDESQLGYRFYSAKNNTQSTKGSPATPKRTPKLEIQARAYYNRAFNRVLPFFSLTMGQLFVIGLYATVNLCALLFEFNSRIDTKRPGHIAVVQFPLVILLTSKNSPLALVGKSYDKLQFLHRAVGRCIVLMASIHAGLMIKGASAMHMLDYATHPTQRYGLAGLIALGLIVFSSIPIIRRWCHQAFIIIHILGYIIFSVAIYLHVPYARPWIIGGTVIMLTDALVRALLARKSLATFSALRGNFVKIEVKDCTGWRAGQHVRLRVLRGCKWMESHPLTITRSSTRPESNGLVLYVKGVGKWSRSLREAKPETITPGSSPDEISSKRHSLGGVPISNELVCKCPVLLQGPYGFSYNVPTDFETVVLIAGGSGITYILSCLDSYVVSARRAFKSKASLVMKRIKVIWAIADSEAAEVFIDDLDELVREAASYMLTISIQVNITQHIGKSVFSNECEVSEGRPSIPILIERMLEYTLENKLGSSGEGMYVAVCGPEGLIKSTRNAVSNLDRYRSGKAGGVVIHSEAFGW